jgi:mono/diheme cytochrome c family protein
MRRTALRILVGLLAVLLLLAIAVVMLNLRDEPAIDVQQPGPPQATRTVLERGAYLARAGNCGACHTARGGAPYAGGPAILTPFGTVYASNLTPDPVHGIGRWTAAHFFRAMHNGRSMDGRLLYPAFPYPNFTQVTREDSDAIYAYLRSQPAVAQPNRPHALRFPYNSQAALAVWRALFFEPETFRPDAAKSAEWNRGSYLVRGLAHCNACHGSRNLFGATVESLELSGGLIPMQNWYAPSLASPAEAGVAQWDEAEIVALLKVGVSARGSVMGPMAEVVYRSTQHLSDADLRAMALFLKQLPQRVAVAPEDEKPPVRDPSRMERGAKVYDQQCAQCHGDRGQGAAGAYPALAGNRAVTMKSTANLVRVVVSGGYLPSTAGNPRPYGMPPFSQVLSDTDIAAVLSHIRGSWGNNAPEVVPIDVLRYR